MVMANRLSERLVAGIAAQDQAAIEACFSDDAQFRALIPPGFRERSGAAEASALIAAWFSDSTTLELGRTQAEMVRDRPLLRLSAACYGIATFAV